MDFSYLAPPPTVNSIQHPTLYQRNQRVKAYQKDILQCLYDDYEQQAIQKLKKVLREKAIEHDYDECQLLKFCYSGDFDYQKILEKVKAYRQWMADPNIQNPNSSALSILQQGIFYSYGRDYQFRPIIVFNIARMDLDNKKLEDYFSALNTLVNPIRQFMFVPGKVQNWVWIIDTQNKLNLPAKSAATVIQRMGAVFSSTLHKLFVVNSSGFMSVMYKGIKRFIHPQTQSKIQVLSLSEMNRLLQFIAPDELQTKYGGKMPNLSVYWPIKSTNKLRFHTMTDLSINNVNSRMIIDDNESIQNLKTQYYSVVNDDDRFLIQQRRPGCCCTQSQCLLF